MYYYFYFLAKERYSKVQGVLNKVTPYEFDSVPEFINKIHLIYVPEMGFLLVIPFWAENLTNADLLLPSLQLKVNKIYIINTVST